MLDFIRPGMKLTSFVIEEFPQNREGHLSVIDREHLLFFKCID